MRAALIHAPGDVRVTEIPDPTITDPTDAIIRVTASCVCGSDLWAWRGVDPIEAPAPIGHEYIGIVETIGDAVQGVNVGDFVIGSFLTSDNTCPNCEAGYQSACSNGSFLAGAQAELLRVPHADGTLVALPSVPDDKQIPDLLALSDVMGTGWYAAVSAGVRPGSTVVVVGDGAVGLCGIIAARQLGADRIIAMSRHESRQALALELGATDIVAERGDDGIARIKELTSGAGADAVLECVGTGEAIRQAIQATKPGGTVGYVGMPHDLTLAGPELFYAQIGLRGGPAPVRRFLPELVELVLTGQIHPGRVFDLDLPLEQAATAFAAMDDRTAIKVILRP